MTVYLFNKGKYHPFADPSALATSLLGYGFAAFGAFSGAFARKYVSCPPGDSVML